MLEKKSPFNELAAVEKYKHTHANSTCLQEKQKNKLEFDWLSNRERHTKWFISDLSLSVIAVGCRWFVHLVPIQMTFYLDNIAVALRCIRSMHCIGHKLTPNRVLITFPVPGKIIDSLAICSAIFAHNFYGEISNCINRTRRWRVE